MDFTKLGYMLIMLSILCFVFILPVFAENGTVIQSGSEPGLCGNQTLSIYQPTVHFCPIAGRDDVYEYLTTFMKPCRRADFNQYFSYCKYDARWNCSGTDHNSYSNLTIPLSEPVLTSAQEKLSIDLLQLIDERFLPEWISHDALEYQMHNNHQLMWVDENGSITENKSDSAVVYVYIKTNDSIDESLLQPFLWEVTGTDLDFHLIVSWVSVNNLTPLASLDSVLRVRTVIPPSTNMNTADLVLS